MSGTYLGGIATLLINGDAWNVVSDLKCIVNGLRLEIAKGQTAVEGFTAMPDEGVIAATIRDRPDEAISQFRGATGLTVQVMMANGKTYTGTQMGVVELGEVDTKDGTVQIKFAGASVSEGVG